MSLVSQGPPKVYRASLSRGAISGMRAGGWVGLVRLRARCRGLHFIKTTRRRGFEDCSNHPCTTVYQLVTCRLEERRKEGSKAYHSCRPVLQAEQNSMSASVVPVIGRLSTAVAGSGVPAAAPVCLPAEPVSEHFGAEAAESTEQLATACSITENTLIFPSLVRSPAAESGGDQMLLQCPCHTRTLCPNPCQQGALGAKSGCTFYDVSTGCVEAPARAWSSIDCNVLPGWRGRGMRDPAYSVYRAWEGPAQPRPYF